MASALAFLLDLAVVYWLCIVLLKRAAGFYESDEPVADVLAAYNRGTPVTFALTTGTTTATYGAVLEYRWRQLTNTPYPDAMTGEQFRAKYLPGHG